MATRRDGRGKQPRERGAVLVHTAIAMVALLGFSAMVVDYGVFWVARRQAQNSADAGALAGAMALAFDDPNDLTAAGAAQRNAKGAAESNLVMGQVPSVQYNNDITFPICPDGVPDRCVRVDVYRTVLRSNPLPSFFAKLLGINTQDIQATATAQILAGNSTNCLKPFGIADKWDEYDMSDGLETEYNVLQNGDPDFWELTPPNGMPTFDLYPSPHNPAPEPDLYVPPGAAGSGQYGTGYRIWQDPQQTTFCCDYGRQIQLKGGSPDQISPGWFAPLRVDCPGGNCYRDAIIGCSAGSASTGSQMAFDTQPGNLIGPTNQGINGLIALDPNANWYDACPVANAIQCTAGTTCGCVYNHVTRAVNASPRIGTFPVFDPDQYLAAGPNGMQTVAISKLIGIFIEGTSGGGNNQAVLGRLMPAGGDLAPGNTTDNTASFIMTIKLVR